jgi:hypothetical protein
MFKKVRKNANNRSLKINKFFETSLMGWAFCPYIHSNILETPFSIKIRCFFQENNDGNMFHRLFYMAIDN